VVDHLAIDAVADNYNNAQTANTSGERLTDYSQ